MGGLEVSGKLAARLRQHKPQGEDSVQRRPQDSLGAEDLMIFDALPVRQGFDVSRLSRLAGLPARTVLAGLGRLEVLGLAHKEEGSRWRKLGAV